MKIYKSNALAKPLAVEEELKLINSFAKTELTEDQIYIFSVLLCDNEVDRDFEKFSLEALEELKELFVGKTGIFDHEWKAENQKARIYRTELIKDEKQFNSVGEPLYCLRGYAYMLKTPQNEELINEIEAGIKKETSIGCSVTRRVCSICGEELHLNGCGHVPGKTYDGKVCYYELFDAKDAYEWSFVAVPAQRAAGVMKSFEDYSCLKELVRASRSSGIEREYELLEKNAALGREYRDSLYNEVLRLGLVCDRKLHEALKLSAKHMDANELLCVKDALETQLSKRFPARTQFVSREETVNFDGGDYIV